MGGANGPKCISAASGGVKWEELPEVRQLTDEMVDQHLIHVSAPAERPPVRVIRKSSGSGKSKGEAKTTPKAGGETASEAKTPPKAGGETASEGKTPPKAGGETASEAKITPKAGGETASDGKTTPDKKKKAKGGRIPGKVKRIALIVSIVLAVGIIGIIIYVWYSMNQIVDSIHYVPNSLNFDKVDVLVSESDSYDFVSHSDETKNILLCGSDIDKYGVSRTDSMIILTIDHHHKTIKMTSLMRDMYVQIPGHGKNKLNASFTYGGGDLILKTVYSNFGIKIDRFVCVDYQVFASVVDTLGGVEVEIEAMELEQFNKYVKGGKKNRIAKAGTYNMNGQQALSYCRIRKVGTDTARTARQRKVLREIMKKCKSLSPVEAQRILSIAAPYVTTNMSRDEMTSLALEGLGCLQYETLGLRIPMDGAWSDLKINGIWYVSVDLKKNARYLHEFIYGDNETARKLAEKQQKSDDKKADNARAAYERKNRKKKK